MRAVLYDKGNSPDVFVVREVDKPIPKHNEVLVKVVAASFNAIDYRTMKMGLIPKSKIFGSDIAGRIEAAGEGTGKFAVGDAVCGVVSSCGYGGFAEYVAVPESVLIRKPVSVTFEEAAAVPLAAITALGALRKGDARPGQTVLICGAGGGVGTFAVQLAKHFGAEVTAVCSERTSSVASSLGADHVIDYARTDFTRAGKRYDLVLAVNGNYPLSAYRRLLAPGGVCVVVGGTLSQLVKFMLFRAFVSSGGKTVHVFADSESTDDVGYVMRLVEEGRVKPFIDRRYPLDKAAEALRYVSTGHARGKVAIDIGQGA